MIFSARAAENLRAVMAFVPIRAVRRAAEALTDAVRRYADHHRALARVLVLSILVQIFRVLQAWCLGRSLGLVVPLSTYFVFVPIIVLIMQLPITINGIGTSQVAFMRLFVPQGAPEPQVFALSILFLALGIAGSLPGGLMYVVDDRRLRRGVGA